MRGKHFSIYGVQIPRKSLNLCFFTHVPVPHSKFLVQFFISRKAEGVGGSYDLPCQNSIGKYEDDLEHKFISIWYDCSFSKCDRFTILEIISVKLCGIKFITSSLQPW